MSRIGPFEKAPQLLERKAGVIDMMVRDEAGVSALQFYGAPSIDDAYGNPTASLVAGAGATALFTVGKGQQFRSPGLVQRRWGWYGESMRGMSRVAFDPNDYVPAGLPSDEEIWFVRVQESRVALGGLLVVAGAVDIGDPKLGSIYVVPTPIFFGQPRPGLTMQGSAPVATTAVAGAVPPIDLDMQVPNPMHLVFPRRTASCFINCTSGTLLVSTGWGDPMIAVTAAEDAVELGGGVKGLVLAGSGAGVATFSIYTITALGPGG